MNKNFQLKVSSDVELLREEDGNYYYQKGDEFAFVLNEIANFILVNANGITMENIMSKLFAELEKRKEIKGEDKDQIAVECYMFAEQLIKNGIVNYVT